MKSINQDINQEVYIQGGLDDSNFKKNSFFAPFKTKSLNIDKTLLAILLICFSGVAFSFMAVFVNLAGDLPIFQKAFFRNFIALIILLVVYFHKRFKAHNQTLKAGTAKEIGFKDLSKIAWLMLIGRSVCGSLAIIFNFYAISNLELSDSIMLNKLAPIAIILVAPFILNEKITKWQLGLVLIAYIGSIFVVKPTFNNPHLGASIIGFLGGILAGVAYAMVRRASIEKVPDHLIILVFSAFSTIVLLPVVIVVFKPITLAQGLYLIGTGVAATIGQFTRTKAYSLATAGAISIYDYGQVIYAMILGYIFFASYPDFWSIIGYIIICTVAVINYLLTKKYSANKA